LYADFRKEAADPLNSHHVVFQFLAIDLHGQPQPVRTLRPAAAGWARSG
jgi:hypothetical protein